MMQWKHKDETFTIRAITGSDTDRINEYFQSFSEQTLHFFTPHALDREFAKMLTSEDLVNPDTRRFIVTTWSDEEEIVTGYFFFWEWLKKVPWFGIGVRDGYHGRGIGSRMMEFAVQEAKSHNKGGILLITKKDNVNAQGLYKKFGYEIIGEEPSGQHLLILNFSET